MCKVLVVYRLFVCAYMQARPSFRRPLRPSVRPSVYLPIRVFIYLSVLSVYTFFYSFVCLSVCLSNYLYVSFQPSVFTCTRAVCSVL
jgi:hypothetical protein